MCNRPYNERMTKMTHNEINQYLCAILTTLMETPQIPESTLYVAMGCDMDKWNTVKAILVKGNLATFHGFHAYLTDAGYAMAKKVNAFASQA